MESTSKLWLCRQQKPEHPFRLDLGLELNSLEELCYYLYENREQLEEHLWEEPLILWIERELALPRLAGELRQQVQQEHQDIWCAWFFLNEVGMYTKEELQELYKLCMVLEDKDELECQKFKVDRLLQNGNEGRCIREYARLLDITRQQQRESALTASIWHNMGVAYARLYMYQDAVNCFEQACQLNHQQESLQALEQAKGLLAGKEMEVEIPEAVGEPIDLAEPKDLGVYLRQLRNHYTKRVI